MMSKQKNKEKKINPEEKTKNTEPKAEDADNAVPDFDMSQFVADPLTTGIKTEKVLVTVPVKKPNSQIFFRVNPEPKNSIEVYLFEDKEDSNRLYLVSNNILPYLDDQAKFNRIYLAVNTKNDPFLFPVRQPDANGVWNEWHRGQQRCVELAKEKWIRMVPNRSINSYDTLEAQGKLPEPKWPDKSIIELFEIAFKDTQITSEDHPVIKRLQGLI